MSKVIGRPVQSYNLSLIGFRDLACFYGQVGGHPLIGGPVPAWLITLSIVQSTTMELPVIALTVKHSASVIRERGTARKTSETRLSQAESASTTMRTFGGKAGAAVVCYQDSRGQSFYGWALHATPG